jgi:hypothetical protein
MANTIGELNVEIGAKLDKLEAGLNRMEKSIEKAGKNSEKTASQSFERISGIIAGAFSVQAISGFVRKVIEVRSEFERYESVLSNTLGSEARAGLILREIQDFASSTPFQLNELSGAFVKLTNYGLQPSMEAMRQYGDLASAVGKDFDQLAEAVADATTGEFERLKEFGIRASKQGDKVTFTFKEQATEVALTADAIEGYITSLGDLEGVQGSMAVQMQTLGGNVSNLTDNYNKLLTAIGNTDAYSKAITSMSKTLTTMEKMVKVGREIEHGTTWISSIAEWTEAYQLALMSLFGVDYLDQLADGIDKTDKATLEVQAFREELNKLNETAGWSLSYGMEQAGDSIEDVGKKAEKATESFVRLGKEIRKNRTSKETGEAQLKGTFDFRPATEFGDIIRIDPEIQEALTQAGQRTKEFEEQLARTTMVGATFGEVLQSSFDAALINGENFVEVFGNALKNLVLQLISAAATAAILAAVLAPLGPVGFGATFRSLFLGPAGGSPSAGMAGNFGGFFVSGSNLVTSTNRARKQEGRSVR